MYTRQRIPNQWDAARDWTKGAPLSVKSAAVLDLARTDSNRAERLVGIRWEILDSDAALRHHAEKCAKRCAWARELAGMELIAKGQKIEPPDPKLSNVGRVNRLVCPYWWRRRLRFAWHVKAEEALRSLGMVNREDSPYVTQWTRRRRRGQKRTLYLALKAAAIETGEGDQMERLKLIEIALKSPANPAIRRHELMARLRGFEKIAEESHHVARFYTFTAPGALHPYATGDGTISANPNYNGATVREARDGLTAMWARARARLGRLRLTVYGFRIAEPHHCGTPHLHILLWMPAEQAGLIDAVFQVYALAERPDEPGARRYRFNVKRIDPEQGSAVGYIAKYISKNIDGYKVEDDYEAETTGHQGSRRAEAWASCHRIRQFQQIGGPPVGLWRELRRMREPHASEPIERVRSAADAGDYGGFVRALGGIELGRNTPIRLWTELTGEPGRYGEPTGPKPAGIEFFGLRVRTRGRSWRIRWGFFSAPTWTRGNNCTAGEKSKWDSQSRSGSRSRPGKRRKRGSQQLGAAKESGTGPPRELRPGN